MRLWRGHKLWSPLAQKVKVRKDWKAVVGEMAEVGRAPEEAAAHQPEKLIRETPRWQKSNPGKGENNCFTVEAEPWKVKVLLPYVVQNTNSQAGTTTFGRVPVVDPQPYSPV